MNSWTDMSGMQPTPTAANAFSSEMKLPSPPATLARVIEAASKPDISVPELGRLVSSDPGFAVELLRMVNSSLYNRGSRIASIDRAVSMLGVRALRNLALCVAVRNCVHRRELGGFDLNRFWEDSLRRAVAGQMLAERAPIELDPMEAFTAGLLQDLGVLGLVRTSPDRAPRWMEVADSVHEARREAEGKIFRVTHDGLGPLLSSEWHLPPELAIPLQFHHDPAAAPAEHQARCTVASNAELLTSLMRCEDKRALLGRVRETLPESTGLDTKQVDELLEEFGRRVSEVASDLGFRVGNQPSLESILEMANKRLVEINMSYEELVKRLEDTLAEKEELTKQLEQRNRELEQLSLTDDLTGLPNRRSLSGRLSYEIRRAARGDQVCFVVADLDKFKSVNDTWGHEFGDQVLKMVAESLSGAVRDTDMAARLGGEEFGLVLPGADLEGAKIVAERVREAVRSQTLETPTGEVRRFTISMGVAALTGPYTKRCAAERVATRLYKTADAALYRAKENGRDRVELAPAGVPWEDAPRRAA